MKSFKVQLIECKNNGNCVIYDETSKLSILWCKKYNKQCSSKVCLADRVNVESDGYR